jgi:hypothetical protein
MITWTPSAPSVTIADTGVGQPASLDIAVFNGKAFTTQLLQAPTAAQNNSVGISNATASGKDVYIDGCTIWCSLATEIQVGQAPEGFGAVGGFPWRNMRLGGANAVASPRRLSQVGIPLTQLYDSFQLAANTHVFWKPPRGAYFVPAGQALAICCIVVNLQTNCYIYGREY